MKNRFFIADTHFGHSNILKFEKRARPFGSIEEMDDVIIAAWNDKVKSGDEVYHLGDFAINNKFNAQRLNGTIHLIRGNHDPRREDCFNHRFKTVSDLRTIRYTERAGGKTKIVLCHYPMSAWEGWFKGSWMLHGHIHGHWAMSFYRKFDVGVDALVKFRMKLALRNEPCQSDYAPISIEDVEEYMWGTCSWVSGDREAV